MKTTFVRELDHNYLVIEPAWDDALAAEGQYKLRMLENNEIPGFLSLRMQNVNGVRKLLYEVTAKMPLTRLFERQTMSGADISALLTGLQEAFSQAKRYLLQDTDIVLDPDFIFMDQDRRQLWAAYVPGYGQRQGRYFAGIADFVLKHLDHGDRRAVDIGYTLFDRSSETYFSFSGMMDELSGRLVHCSDTVEEMKRPHTGTLSYDNSGERISEEIIEPKHKKAEKPIKNKKKNRPGHGKTGKIAAAGAVFFGAAAVYGCLVCFLSLDLSQSGALAVGMIAVFWLVYETITGKRNAGKGVWDDQLEDMTDQEDMEAEYIAALISESDSRETSGETPFLEEVFGKNEYSENKMREADETSISPTTRLLGSTETLPQVMLISRDIGRCPDIRVENRNSLIGKKREQVDICIPLDVMSRVHARLEIGEGCCYLEDLNSSNGTYLEDELLPPFEKRRIDKSGKEISFANVRFRLVFR